MIGSNIEGQEAKAVLEKLEQTESKYDIFIDTVLSSDEDTRVEDTPEKVHLVAVADGMEVITPTNPIYLGQ
jgi:hypothetical protein